LPIIFITFLSPNILSVNFAMASVESATPAVAAPAADVIAAKKLAAKAGSRSSASRSRSRGASTTASEASGISSVSSTVSSIPAGEEPAERFFVWGCELSRHSDTYVLKFPEDADEDSEVHRLSLRSAALGLNAIEKERNVVELRFVDARGEEKKLAVASLTLGVLDTCKLDLAMNWTRGHDLTLKLVKGSGPLSLIGNHVVETYDEEDDAYVPAEESSAEESGMDTEGDDVEANEVQDIVKDSAADSPKKRSKK